MLKYNFLLGYHSDFNSPGIGSSVATYMRAIKMRILKPLNPVFLVSIFLAFGNPLIATADFLEYREITGYEASRGANTTTLLNLINSRSDLSTLAGMITEVGGLAEAFNTEADWRYTFFAPNNDAFASHTGSYFNTFESTP